MERVLEEFQPGCIQKKGGVEYFEHVWWGRSMQLKNQQIRAQASIRDG